MTVILRCCLVFCLIPCISLLTSCAVEGKDSKLGDWHQQAIVMQMKMSGLMAYYESAPSLIHQGALNSAACGKEEVEKKFSPVAEKLAELANTVPKIAEADKDIEKLLGEASKIVEILRRRIIDHREIISITADVLEEDNCLSAADIVSVRADFEEVFEDILIATIPR